MKAVNETIKLGFERTLKFRKAGKVFSGTLQISKIEKCSAKRWRCSWSMDFLCTKTVVRGADPLDALTSCLFVVSKLVRESEKDGLVVFWQHEGDYGGLPLCE